MTIPTFIDSATRQATRAFLERVAGQYDLAEAFLYGSRARGTQRPDSDADVAVVLRGAHEQRLATVQNLSGIAFDVMLDTGILIQPVPIWEDEWAEPQHFSNPALIANIRKEGVRL